MTDLDPSWLEKWHAKQAARAAKTAHRRVPMPEVEPGHCRWCARPIIATKGKHIGQPDPRRSWCRGCFREFNLHSYHFAQSCFLRERDGDHCAECGENPPPRWFPVEGGAVHCLDWSHGTNDADFLRELWKREDAPYWRGLGMYCPVTMRAMLQVDHVVPLWKVALLDDPSVDIWARRRWFGPDNLQLLCPIHHKAKSKAEAAERAALKRGLPTATNRT